MEIRLAHREGPRRCLFCHDDLSVTEGLYCRGCGARYHNECAAQCVNLGCGGELFPAEELEPFPEPPPTEWSPTDRWIAIVGGLFVLATLVVPVLLWFVTNGTWIVNIFGWKIELPVAWLAYLLPAGLVMMLFVDLKYKMLQDEYRRQVLRIRLRREELERRRKWKARRQEQERAPRPEQRDSWDERAPAPASTSPSSDAGLGWAGGLFGEEPEPRPNDGPLGAEELAERERRLRAIRGHRGDRGLGRTI